jgi:L-histidine Nalpha-methyltransferase / hercynylcysteine S-oxide synthase
MHMWLQPIIQRCSNEALIQVSVKDHLKVCQLSQVDVDNPERCHDHSEIPASWPPLEEIHQYQHDVRARMISSIESGRAESDRRLARGYWLAYEHEAMHLETFLYMLIQSSRVLPPPGRSAPDFQKLAEAAARARQTNAWHKIPESHVTIGMDDLENDSGPDRYFGWDIERPSHQVKVESFEAQSRPISNNEYAHFLQATQTGGVPASWVVSEIQTTSEHDVADFEHFISDKALRTVYGLVPLKYALDWPVMASFDELARYAKWANGRIPTLEEARSIYSYVDTQKLQAPEKSGALIAAVNG